MNLFTILGLVISLGSIACWVLTLVKMFQGVGFDDYKLEVSKCFASVVIRKPKASRARSKEVYILAKGFKF